MGTIYYAHKGKWNIAKLHGISLQEWFCAVCGRTSDHVSECDARRELEQFECEPATTATY
jgi:hypothetical protein